MSEKDYVVPELIVEQKDIAFEMDELYTVLKEWSNINRYDFYEKLHTHTSVDGVNESKIKWLMERKVDDYVRFAIEATMTLKGTKVELKKKGKALKGDIKIKFEAYLEKDYEDTWVNNPVNKFLRAIWDKYALATKMSGYESALKKECYELYNEAKSFLNIHIFG